MKRNNDERKRDTRHDRRYGTSFKRFPKLLRFARELARAAINPELIIPRSVSPARRRGHRNLN